jgi:hypothetical protein
MKRKLYYAEEGVSVVERFKSHRTGPRNSECAFCWQSDVDTVLGL